MAEVRRHLARREKKEKTSVSLSGELIAAVDSLASKAQRSAFIERAVRSYLNRLVRRARNERDLALINASARETNAEAELVMEIQSWPD